MDSKYLTKVLRLLRKIYPGQVWKETNLQNLVQGTNFSPELKRLISLCGADLRKMHVDLYVKGQVAIEVHGEQHAKAIKFSNEILDPEAELLRRQQLDQVKDMALAEAGVPLVTVWYSELKDGQFTEEILRDRIRIIQEIANKVPKQKRLNVKVPIFRTRTESFEARRDRLAKARKIRKAAYRKAKLNRKKKV
jgi:DNA-binding protein YbaB